MVRVNREHLVGIVCLAVAATVLSLTPRFPAGQATVGITGPAFFPNVLAIAFLVAGIEKLVRGTVLRDKLPAIDLSVWGERLRRPETVSALLLIALLVLFVALFEVLGFAICTLAFLFIFMRRLSVRPLRSAIYAVAFTAVIYLMFEKLFGVSLPPGVLGLVGIS